MNWKCVCGTDDAKKMRGSVLHDTHIRGNNTQGLPSQKVRILTDDHEQILRHFGYQAPEILDVRNSTIRNQTHLIPYRQNIEKGVLV